VTPMAVVGIATILAGVAVAIVPVGSHASAPAQVAAAPDGHISRSL
jgi:hypothetical protein